MDVIQVANLANDITKELLGKENLMNEDLSNAIDVGNEIFSNVEYDRFVKSLVDHIGRVRFLNRKVEGGYASLQRDSWEYGACAQRVYPLTLADAVENESWELVDGASYDPNIFHSPAVGSKFYQKMTTLECDLSIADRQCRGSFSNGQQLTDFVSMLYSNIDNTLTVKEEGLAQRCINNLILNTVNAEFPSVSDNDYSSSTGVKAINLLKMYNTQYGLTGTDALTASNCMFVPAFIRYATFVISRTMKRLKKISTLFTVSGIPNFTPASKQHLVLLSDFASAAEIFLQSDVFNKNLVNLPAFEDVPYWQGTGTDYGDDDVATIKAEIIDGSSTKQITLARVFGVAFDHDAAGITTPEGGKRVTSNYNGKAEFTNYFYKLDQRYWNDFNCPAVVFFAA